MSDCGCDKARTMLEEYVHQELRGGDLQDVRDHLDHCPDCEAEVQIGRVLSDVLARACCETAPDELKSRVLLRLRAVTVETSGHASAGGPAD